MSEQQQYRTVLKSTSLSGGAALLSVLIGLVRTKAVAVLLGPAGVGLAGLFVTLLAPVSTFAGLGLAQSGVRLLAEARGAGDEERVATVAAVLRRLVLLAGLFGCLLTAALSPWLSRWTFKSEAYALSIACLGLTVLLGNVAAGQACVLQGLRKIAELAKIGVWGAAGGTALSIPCFYLWGLDGIVISLLLVSAFTALVSWLFARRLGLRRVRVPSAVMWREAGGMLRLGLPLMGTALMGAAVAYGVRLIVMARFGLEGVGLWGAAFNISGLLVGFVLNAMGTDYYPKLAAIAHDNVRVSGAVNTQVEVALTCALPALLLTILFAPLGIHVLYSGQFDAAIPVLRWSAYGMFLRVITWPLGFIILAQGKGGLYFLNDLYANAIYVVAIYYCGKCWGLAGLGVAGMLQYAGYLFFILPVAYGIARTTWSRRNLGLVCGSALLLGVAGMLPCVIKDQLLLNGTAAGIVLATAAWAVTSLSKRTGLSFWARV